MNILVIEDEQQLAGFIRTGLEEQGFGVEVSHDGDEGFSMATLRDFDALVLDINLPGRDGLSILSELRKNHNAVPVVLLTARAGLEDRIEGLNLGADDYLTKPFYVGELIARLNAVTRRHSGNSTLQSDGLAVNLITREVRVDNTLIDLTRREFMLLEYLLRSPGRVFTRTQILEHVWGFDFDPETNLVDVHVKRLRTKLCRDDRERFIETVRGVGYSFRNIE